MGFFSKLFGSESDDPPEEARASRDAFTRRRKFALPYEPEIVLELITSPYEIPTLDEPPIVETVYFSSKSNEMITFTGGNRLKTHWNILIELQSMQGGTTGTVYVDRPQKDVHKWIGNIFDIVPKMHMRLASAGATFTGWSPSDIFN